MSLFGMFSNPIDFDSQYNMKKLTTREIENSDFEELEQKNRNIKQEIYDVIVKNKSLVLANIIEKKVRAIYILEEKKKRGQKQLQQTESFYISKMSSTEKKECFKSVAHHSLNLVTKAKYNKITLRKPNTRKDLTIETTAKNPNLQLIVTKALYFFFAFIVAFGLGDIVSGLLCGLFCSLAFGGVKASISDDLSEEDKEDTRKDNPEDFFIYKESAFRLKK